VKAAAWADADGWRALVDGSGCPICTRGGPLDVIADFESVWVTASAEAQLPGYACVVSKIHVTEPYELGDEAATSFWRETMVVAQRLAEHTRAVKMNYGIHGNRIPHLHVHLWPRYPDDPYDVGGIPAGAASFVRTTEELAAMAAAIRR